MIKRLQIGRSMVEMLGVLAIIGVLSIGGMTMYRKAILNYRLGQTQHWIETVRFIIAEACANGNQNGCFIYTQPETDYKKLADYVCSQGGTMLCPAGFSNEYGSLQTPLQERFVLLRLYDFDHVTVFFRFYDEAICKAIIDYDWHGLKSVRTYTNEIKETVPSGQTRLTDAQKEHLKAECPDPKYIILTFDLKS